MESVDVSVIICPQSASGLLPVSLAHLEIQTFPAGRFEILVAERCPALNEDLIERYAQGTPVRTRLLHAPGASLGAARNRAIEAASGTWLLFLEENLLASPHLVEEHVAAQEDGGGACAVIGRIEPHPQIREKRFLSHLTEPSRRLLPNQPLCFLDWRAWNLSLPRKELVEAGGFDEEYAGTGFGDIDLAWRLATGGMPGFRSQAACAYVWQQGDLEEERRRCYQEGYTLPRLMERTRDEMVTRRFGPLLSGGRGIVDWALCAAALPFSALLPEAAATVGLFCAPMLRTAFRKGYRDAAAGRPPAMWAKGGQSGARASHHA